MSAPRSTMLKIIILGSSNVGKTSLLHQYVNEKFLNTYKATIGSDFVVKETMIDETRVAMQIWDTAGQERFQSLGTAFFRGADCCVLVFDITDRVSFDAIDKWREEFLHQAQPRDPETFPFVLMGNKIDNQADRKVDSGDAEQWCADRGGIKYFEVSAKDATNVDVAFRQVAVAAFQHFKEIKAQQEQEFMKSAESSKIDLNASVEADGQSASSSTCC